MSEEKTEEPLFQVLLLDNDATLDVTVQEAQQVDFSSVKEHLKNGGSVFITSKKQQKIAVPNAGKAQQNYAAARRSYGALIQKTCEKQSFV